MLSMSLCQCQNYLRVLMFLVSLQFSFQSVFRVRGGHTGETLAKYSLAGYKH